MSKPKHFKDCIHSGMAQKPNFPMCKKAKALIDCDEPNRPKIGFFVKCARCPSFNKRKELQ